MKAQALTEAAKKLVDKNPQIMELAKQRVEEAQAAAADDLSELVSGLPLKEEEAA